MRKRIILTDSGFGGLSIAASLYEKVKHDALDIIFVNVLPHPGQGYNTMPDTATQIAVFNKALQGIERHFDPGMIGIACNTLSAIVKDTQYFLSHPNQIMNIIDLTIRQMVGKIKDLSNRYIIIFGTETTIRSGIYQRSLQEAGIPTKYIIPIICSGLASEIELDYNGRATKQIVNDCFTRVKAKIRDVSRKQYFLLACTHYGYISDYFATTAMQSGLTDFEIIDPNNYMISTLLAHHSADHKSAENTSSSKASIAVYSGCTVLKQEVDSISKLIRPVSQQTAIALQKYKVIEDLFS